MTCDENVVDDGLADIYVYYAFMSYDERSMCQSLNMAATLVMNERTVCDAIQSSQNVSNYHTKQDKI